MCEGESKVFNTHTVELKTLNGEAVQWLSIFSLLLVDRLFW
jgi:hypothetical protein